MQTTEIQTIDRETLQQKMNRGDDFVLLEVLPEENYEEGHLPGALHLPPNAIREKAPELVPDRSTEVITYCADRDCDLSEKAARVLTEMGYENVREYPGSKKDWKDASLRLETGAPVS